MKFLNHLFFWAFLWCIAFSSLQAQTCNPTSYNPTALGWVATGTDNSGNVVSAGSVFNGNLGNRWEGGPGAANRYLRVDMLTPTHFNQLVLNFQSNPNDYPQNFVIETSNDATNWEILYTSATMTGAINELPIDLPDNPEARYFQIRLTAGNAGGIYWGVTQIYVKIVEANCPLSNLAKPAVTATANGCGEISLAWDDVPDATSYNVYQCADIAGNNRTLLQNNAASPFIHSGLASSTTYFYRVEATDGTDASRSDVVSATTTASANPRPTIISATPGYNSVDLTFSLPASALSNELYRSTSAAGRGNPVNDYDGSASTFTDSGLSEGTTCYYTLVSTFGASCPTEHSLSVKTLAHIAYPDPFNCSASTCPELVGYVNFAKSDGTETGRWSIDDIDYYGNAGAENQNITLASNLNYQATGDLITERDYFIVKNPNSVKGGNSAVDAETLQDVDALGGVFLVRGGDNNSLIYKITGLNKGTDAKATYCIRIKMRNVGRASQADNNDRNNACQGNGNNIRVTLLNLTGGNISNNAGINNRYGTYTTTNTGDCTTSDINLNWTENQQQNTMTKYGDLTVFEGAITTGTEDGFQIQIRGIGAARNTITGIESIEIYGCLPRELTVEDANGNRGTTFCENAPITFKTAGAGFSGNIEWFKGETLADALASTDVLSTGGEFASRAPLGVGTSEWYVARSGIGGYEAIEITSKFCCENSIEVFKEDFSAYTNWQFCDAVSTTASCPQITRDLASFGNAVTSIGGEPLTQYLFSHERPQNCTVDDGSYAIARNARDGHSAFACMTSRTPGKGMLLINASYSPDYFYQIDLENVCSGTTYDLSVWYANISPDQPINIGIMLEVWEIDGSARRLVKDAGPFDSGIPKNSDWHEATLSFTTPVDASGSPSKYYMLRMRNAGVGGNGNDFAIDEILVTKCMSSIHIEGEGQRDEIISCSTTGVELQINAQQSILDGIAEGSISGNVYYQWAEVAANGNLISLLGAVQELPPDGRAGFTTPAFPAGTVKYYQTKVSSDPDRVALWATDLARSCGNDTKTPVVKVEIKTGDRIIPQNNFRCGAGQVELTATSSNGADINWYGTPTGSLVLGTTHSDEIWITSYIGVTTTYYAEVTGGNACVRLPITATINAVPPAPQVTDVSICLGGNLDPLTTDGNETNLRWYTSAADLTGSTAAPTPSTATAGTTSYYVTQTANGCESPRAEIQVTVTNNPQPAQVTPYAACPTDNATFIPWASRVQTAGTLSWYEDATTPTPMTLTTFNTSEQQQTSRWVEVRNTATGCSTARTEVSVTVHTLPVINFQPITPLCANDNAITLSATNSDNLQGTFSGKGVSGDTFSPNLAGAGSYPVTYSLTTANGCPVAATQNITVYTVPDIINVSAPGVCPEDALTITAIPGGFTQYLWTIDGVLQSETGSILVYEEEKLPEQVIPISVVAVSAQGCRSDAVNTAATIFSVPGGITLLPQPVFCVEQGKRIDWNNYVTAGADRVQWFADEEALTPIAVKSIDQSVAETYTLYATAVSEGGCRADIVPIPVTITVHENPVLDKIDKSDLENIRVTVSGGEKPYIYHFEGYSGDTDGLIKLGFVPIGVHDLLVVDQNGCVLNSSVLVSEYSLIPDGFFTPNGDGKNEIWKIKYLGYYRDDDVTISVFDRNGKELLRKNARNCYITADNYGEVWDGTFKGKLLPSDDYWYVISIGKLGEQMTGHFSLKR